MRIRLRWSSLFVFAVSLFICQEAGAASLTGKVIEVNDGDEITVFNLNRPVRIKLLAIDAPEKDQVFGAAAKQHLFDLVYDKFVTVEYTGIGEHSSLLGRVVIAGSDSDICAQMIRDGAAWFDPFNKNLLNETQREIYRQSELAARNERRGLWQVDGAVAPWEFVKAEQLRKNPPVVIVPSVLSNQPVRRDRATPELTNLNLLNTGTAVAQPSSAFEDMSFADGSIPRIWKRFQPPGATLSVMVPDGGKLEEKEKVFASGVIPVNTYLVKERDSVYQVIWIKGPDRGETDAAILQGFLRSYLRAANNFLDQAGLDVECEASAVRNVALGDYKGREFDMSQCPVPHYLRLYTKVSNGERLVFGGLVAFKQEGDNASRFLKSFTVLEPKSAGPKNVGPKSRVSTN